MLSGFAAGVMFAASIWSLILPSIESCEAMGTWAFVPVLAGFWAGVLFLLFMDDFIPHIHVGSNEEEGPQNHLKKTTKIILAVVLHNIPEGLAVGVVFAGAASGNALVSFSGAMALSLGIAIQNIPEGAIISMPLHAAGLSRIKAFLYGTLSGAAEPIASVLTILAAGLVAPALPYFLSFAAGTMVYVVVEELIPSMSQGDHFNGGTIFFAVGFSIMMVLDVILG